MKNIFEVDSVNIFRVAGLLFILAQGCKTHPSYRAKRKVITTCDRCNEMWEARQELVKLNIM